MSRCLRGAQGPMWCLRWLPCTVAGLSVAGGFARRWHCLAANHAGGPNLDSGMEAQMCLLPEPGPGAGPGTPDGREEQGQCVFAAGSCLPAKFGGFPADHKTLWLGGRSGSLLPGELWAAPGVCVCVCENGGGAPGVSDQLFGEQDTPGVISGSATDHLGGLLARSGPWGRLGTYMVPPHQRLERWEELRSHQRPAAGCENCRFGAESSRFEAWRGCFT